MAENKRRTFGYPKEGGNMSTVPHMSDSVLEQRIVETHHGLKCAMYHAGIWAPYFGPLSNVWGSPLTVEVMLTLYYQAMVLVEEYYIRHNTPHKLSGSILLQGQVLLVLEGSYDGAGFQLVGTPTPPPLEVCQ
jgi:hypothetical protein